MRRRRRPARLPQLAERRPHRRPGQGLERRDRDDSALRAAHPRHADVPLRRTGLAAHAVDQRHQPRRVDARTLPHPRHPRPGEPVHRRPDLYLTETARLADVVLPAATWAEKTGTFTNAEPHRAPVRQGGRAPGEAKSDLDIFLDYARRMDFRDKDGGPLVAWHDPESSFEAWKRCTAGRRLRLHRSDLRQAPRRQRHPVALQRHRARRHRTPHTPTASPGHTPTSARTTAKTWKPERPPASSNTAPSTPPAKPCSRPRLTIPRTKHRTPNTRSS
ncbi:molybdopterin-dependent oxidoreductase [Yinghuangia aomiensis]